MEPRLSSESLEFFLEAQNDALISHIQASIGSWRVALKSLRSCIENSILTLYYMDHPVELKLWKKGKHKLGFSETLKYLEQHPDFHSISKSVCGLEILKKEYEVLSRAVHGSAKTFRMTEDGIAVNVWDANKTKLNQWSSREKSVLLGINLALLTIFREHLQGTSHTDLRKVISLIIPTSKDASIKTELGIKIKRS